MSGAAETQSENLGQEAYELMERMFPLCRSLTGRGVQATFDALDEIFPITRTQIPTGTHVFDWLVPDQWTLRDAHITDPSGERILDLRESSLHVVSYSEPVHATLSLESLRDRLFTLPEQPDVIPYRTSYYKRTWGFCLTHRQLLGLKPGDYEVVIDSTLEAGNLTYAEMRVPGTDPDAGEILFSTYVCHPSLANDNLSGIAVSALLARELSKRTLRHTYRFLFAPGTIGPLCWLHVNRDGLARIRHGVALSCLGDAGSLTYKRSRQETAEVDLAMETVLRDSGRAHRILPWDPWGGDERQFCSPGFNLPVGTLMRTPHGEFDGYHTSADSLDRILPGSLADAVDTCLELCEVLETNGSFVNLSPYGEPQLGRRGLYRSTGGAVSSPELERALLWVLNLSDGQHSLLDIARRAAIPYDTVQRAAIQLSDTQLLAPA